MAMEENKWSIYILTNLIRKEIYYGVSSEPMDKLGYQSVAENASLEHWDRENEKMLMRVLIVGLEREAASELALWLEPKLLPEGFSGFKVIQTVGTIDQ